MWGGNKYYCKPLCTGKKRKKLRTLSENSLVQYIEEAEETKECSDLKDVVNAGR